MINYIKKATSFFNSLFSKQEKTPVKQIYSKSKIALSAEKQAELNTLCQQLFKQKELITSGKFQFIGLSKIKKRLGKRWEGLSKVVYEMADEVIDKYMDKGDIFIRYTDDTYIIIFAHATPQESQIKATAIAEEIKQRLFELDEEELRTIEIRQAVSELSTEKMMEAGALGDMFGAMDDELGDLEFGFQEKEQEEIPLPDIQATEVGAEYQRNSIISDTENDGKFPQLTYAYAPLWDTNKGALTTYICLSKETDAGQNPFDAHKKPYIKKSLSRQLELDKAILEVAAKELQSMQEDGRKFFIVCPVQHSVVYDVNSYEEYKKLLSEIPFEQRKFLLLLVLGMDNSQPIKNSYWFAKPLRTFCPHIFAEVPLHRNINFNYLNNSGVDVAGVKLDQTAMTEQETLKLLNNFSTRAKSFKMAQTFILNVPSLSITTSAVCAGFDFLGGEAIHDLVDKPNSVHRYHHADLIKKLQNTQ